MEMQQIKELALANGFKLKEQASGNMDLNAYVYDFANAIEQAVIASVVPYESCSVKSHEIIINETKSELINDYDIAKEDEYLLESLVYRGVCIGNAQASVAVVFAIGDVITERKRQINQEGYSTKSDDAYQQNELLRAAVCYADNVVSRGWVHDSHFGPEVYQSEEAPDLWPWGLDFWKPKNPRLDLVRAAALLIAEIERMDRSTGKTNAQ